MSDVVLGFENDVTLSPATMTPVMPPRFVPVTVTDVPTLPTETESFVIVGVPRYCAAAEVWPPLPPPAPTEWLPGRGSGAESMWTDCATLRAAAWRLDAALLKAPLAPTAATSTPVPITAPARAKRDLVGTAVTGRGLTRAAI